MVLNYILVGCPWAIASFKLPKIQAAESQLYSLLIFFLHQILLPISRTLYWLHCYITHYITFYTIYVRWYLQFIRSEFRGQLPKPYTNAPNATKIIPTQMNDMNEEEPSRYVSNGMINELLITVS